MEYGPLGWQWQIQSANAAIRISSTLKHAMHYTANMPGLTDPGLFIYLFIFYSFRLCAKPIFIPFANKYICVDVDVMPSAWVPEPFSLRLSWREWVNTNCFICFFSSKCFSRPLKMTFADTDIIQNKCKNEPHTPQTKTWEKGKENGNTNKRQPHHTSTHHSSKFIMCCINYYVYVWWLFGKVANVVFSSFLGTGAWMQRPTSFWNNNIRI